MTARESRPIQASGPRLRFAPSPTGFLHVGGARTALFNWLYARHHNGAFLLRVEDTDKARSTDESTKAIFEGLSWLGLNWDEDVVFQGANVERHRRDAHALLEAGHAYRDFTSVEELARLRAEAEQRGETFFFDRRIAELPEDEVKRRLDRGDPFTIRFRVPEGTTTWTDLVHGPISFPNKDIDDFIVLRSDATPIYNLAVVSDDIAMGITLVMRGDDHISNTPKQILLYHALGAPTPEFAHLPMILGPDGKKLSKRHGATAVGDYEHLGILPAAMRNFLALLGWSPGDDREILALEELIALFEARGLLKKAAVFDTTKLEWMNGQYIQSLALPDLDRMVRPFVAADGSATSEDLDARLEWWHGLLALLQSRSRTLVEMAKSAAPYLIDRISYDSRAVAKHWKDAPAVTNLLEQVAKRLEDVEWTPASLEESLRSLAGDLGVGAGALFQPLRVALVGSAESPGIFDVLNVLGREKSLRRLALAKERLAQPV